MGLKSQFWSPAFAGLVSWNHRVDRVFWSNLADAHPIHARYNRRRSDAAHVVVCHFDCTIPAAGRSMSRLQVQPDPPILAHDHRQVSVDLSDVAVSVRGVFEAFLRSKIPRASTIISRSYFDFFFAASAVAWVITHSRSPRLHAACT